MRVVAACLAQDQGQKMTTVGTNDDVVGGKGEKIWPWGQVSI